MLPANLADNCTEQINHLLLNDTDLFHFFSRPPMPAIFYERKTLRTLAGLKQHIIGSCKQSFP
jgi:hypothetical protein